MATECKEFEQELVLYHYGELSGSDRNNVAVHTRDCAHCALYLKELETLLPLTVQGDEPPEEFWQNYSREMRHKLADIQEIKPWWQTVRSYFRPWAISALATTAVIALALTLTLGKKTPAPNDAPTDDEVFMEILPMADNLDLLNHMDVLDNMDLLEFMVSQGNNAV